MHKVIVRLLKSEKGATAIEYALIASLIAVVIVTAVRALGTHITTTFTSITAAI